MGKRSTCNILWLICFPVTFFRDQSALEHALKAVKQQIDQLSVFSSYRRVHYGAKFWQHLSLADVIALDQTCWAWVSQQSSLHTSTFGFIPTNKLKQSSALKRKCKKISRFKWFIWKEYEESKHRIFSRLFCSNQSWGQQCCCSYSNSNSCCTWHPSSLCLAFAWRSRWHFPSCFVSA